MLILPALRERNDGMRERATGYPTQLISVHH